jgi:nucleotide-binding universal stress UspA family protein
MKKPPKKILVGLKDASGLEELLGLAHHVAPPGKVQIVVLHVEEVPPATPLDAEDEALAAPGRAVEQAVKRLAKKYPRRKITVRLLRARHAGAALVDELKAGKFELAVIGYHHKRSLAELILGTTAKYLAEHAPCRLLMSVPPRG